MGAKGLIENFLEIKNGQLTIDGVGSVELVNNYGSPLFVFSERRIRHNVERLKMIRNVIGCPLKICYAAKAMSTMAILRVVRDAGIDIEVNSGGELWKALKAGFDPSQIIFNGTSKEAWEIEMAIDHGIYAIQVDSLFELSLIDETAKRLDKNANVSLRLVPEIETDTHSGLQTALLTSKFGMMPDEAISAFHQFKHSSNVSLTGIHLHIGSQNPDPSVYADALKLLFTNLISIYEDTGVKLHHLNLGGGFPVDYLRDDSLGSKFDGSHKKLFSSVYEPADALAKAWDVVLDAAEFANATEYLKDTTLLIEPGRSIVADTGVCLMTVRNKKERPVSRPDNLPAGTPAKNDVWLLTDAGFNILLSMETYKWYYHLISASRSGQKHDQKYKLAGPLCDGGDVYFDIEGQGRLPDHRELPSNVEPGEILAMLNCGAYSLAQASQYNGRLLPAVVLIRGDGTPELIRRRDDLNDLINNDVY